MHIDPLAGRSPPAECATLLLGRAPAVCFHPTGRHGVIIQYITEPSQASATWTRSHSAHRPAVCFIRCHAASSATHTKMQKVPPHGKHVITNDLDHGQPLRSPTKRRRTGKHDSLLLKLTMILRIDRQDSWAVAASRRWLLAPSMLLLRLSADAAPGSAFSAPRAPAEMLPDPLDTPHEVCDDGRPEPPRINHSICHRVIQQNHGNSPAADSRSDLLSALQRRFGPEQHHSQLVSAATAVATAGRQAASSENFPAPRRIGPGRWN